MNIMYCGDNAMMDGLVISLMSITEHVSEPLNIYVLTATIKTAQKSYEPLSYEQAIYLDELVKGENPASSVELVDITDIFNVHVPIANMNTRFTPNCMLRLYADLVPQIPDRVLYLDTDVICRENFRDMYSQDLTGHELAGILDYYGSWFFKRNYLKLTRDYLNSGVLLLNMKYIRETGLFAQCRIRCQTKQMFMPDQSALNKLCATKLVLKRRYNEQRRLHKNTVFQHFTTTFRFFPTVRTVTVKPWDVDRVHSELGLHEYDELLEKYEQLSHDLEVLNN
ncbi:glycosyltransferase [Alloscardovia venturai]|uniref:Glycosyltransferase n=1 Tax=Alloscardovia venturai TaxID=1769421 RepID=A0ABW2Y789_9BIFI